MSVHIIDLEKSEANLFNSWKERKYEWSAPFQLVLKFELIFY